MKKQIFTNTFRSDRWGKECNIIRAAKTGWVLEHQTTVRSEYTGERYLLPYSDRFPSDIDLEDVMPEGFGPNKKDRRIVPESTGLKIAGMSLYDLPGLHWWQIIGMTVNDGLCGTRLLCHGHYNKTHPPSANAK